MRLIDTSHPFYSVKWRRYAVVALPCFWAILEFSWGNTGWAAFTALIGAYVAWHLVIKWPAEKTD